MPIAQRQTELDWLRGLMLVLMTVTHLPTWYSAEMGQPFGFVSAAEGFVFLSGFLVGAVYLKVAREQGLPTMRRRIWRRAGVIYAAHVALLLFLLWVVLPVAVARGAHPVTDLASFYLEHPHVALVAGLALVYNPPLLDILPMYVIFMLAAPFVLASGARHGWGAIGVASALLWLAAQFHLGGDIYNVVTAPLRTPVPYRETGAFSFLAWQAVWVAGLWGGARSLDGPALPALRQPGAIAAAAVVAIGFFAWRHVAGQAPESPALVGLALDKWHLGALRIVNFAALMVLVLALRDAIARHAAQSALTTMGRVSLTVFTAHAAICLVVLAFVADPSPAHLRWRDTAIVLCTLAALYVVAWLAVEGRRALPTLSARLAARMDR
ncbi:MAG TPA: OpgC domain-containing protein [Casimicrobiaceae bacterium]|jgi:hypothetical protein|nr:OpgC domain-containing protein [Casimicrobiaceae bacterium]